MSPNQNASRMANKVSLSMRYVTGTDDPVAAQAMLEDAIAGLKQFLDLIEPTELKLKYELLHSIFVKQGDTIRNSNDRAAAFCASECEQMRRSGLQEKPIAEIGTQLSAWNCQPVAFEPLADALDRMLGMLNEQSAPLTGTLMRDPVFVDRNKASMDALSGFSCGVALTVNAIERMKTEPDQPLVDAPLVDAPLVDVAAIASFGASLAVDAVNCLSRVVAGE